MWIALTVLFGVLGAVIGRWWAVVIPGVVWPLYFLGAAQEWWGAGLGDGWQFGLALVIVFGLAAAALGVALRSLVVPRAIR